MEPMIRKVPLPVTVAGVGAWLLFTAGALFLVLYAVAVSASSTTDCTDWACELNENMSEMLILTFAASFFIVGAIVRVLLMGARSSTTRGRMCLIAAVAVLTAAGALVLSFRSAFGLMFLAPLASLAVSGAQVKRYYEPRGVVDA